MFRAFPGLVLLLAGTLSTAHAQDGDSYAEMLGYLTATRIDGNALAGATGAIGVNLAAGDGNLQANVRAVAVGPVIDLQITQRQYLDGLAARVPDAMSAVIGGNALAGARGLISINQASGAGNRETNAIAVALAQQGIEEQASEAGLAALATNPDGAAGDRLQASPSSSSRSAVVSASALRGAEGVVQLNQVAGLGNQSANRVVITVDLPPR